MLKKIKSYIKSKRKPLIMNKNKKYKRFKIGDNTYGRPNIFGGGELCIGSFCSISTSATISLGAEHHSDWITTYPMNLICKDIVKETTFSKGKVTIGNDVWIADDALILSGVTIGDGAVIGAKAVVAKDVKPYEIVAGNPAKHVRFRFSETQIEKLLEIKWWNWEIDKVKAEIDLILSDNIDNFIEKHYKKGNR